MKSVTALILVLALATGCYGNPMYPVSSSNESGPNDSNESGPDSNESHSNDSRIIGGTIAPSLVAYQVSLRDADYDFFCGGSIIGSRWVLTAAHCLPVTYVVAGSNKLSPRGTSYTVIREIPHPYYDEDTLENDIALLKVSSNMAFTAIPLPTVNTGTGSALVTGWGLTSNGGSSPNDLRMLTTNVITNSACEASWGAGSIFSTNLCTLRSSGRGNCFGDSGGPLVMGGKLVGVVSWVSTTCALGLPDGYARVYSYLSWISATRAAYP